MLQCHVAISNANEPNRCLEAWLLYSGKAHHFSPVDTNLTSHWSSDKNPSPEKLASFLQNCKLEASIVRKVHWDGAEKEIPPTLILADDEDDDCYQAFFNRSQLNAFIDQLRSKANEIWPAEDAFQFWWDNEGSGMPPKHDEETSVYAERIAKIAWANGAYVGGNAQETGS